jgi:predicted Zn-dependent protease
LGRFARWLSSGARLALLSVVGPIAVVLSTGLAIWKALLGYAAVLLLWGAWRARVRVVIEAFDDYTDSGGHWSDGAGKEKGDTEGKKEVGGEPKKDGSTAVLLANRLAEMRDLYDFVDDPERTATLDKPLGATVQLDDAATVLRDAVTTESTISLGPVSLPLGAVTGLLGRFVQAPRLRGAIHGDDTRLVVTAELSMDGQPYSWRVPLELEQGEIVEGESRREKLDAAIHQELAYQVFSDLTLQREARWPATKFWLIALRNMGECQRRPHRRRLLLKEAEEYFTNALAEDERFYLACLNLGIVKRRLAALDADEKSEQARRGQEHVLAAREVFERAIRLRPDRWEAYHALAEALWGTEGLSGSLEMIAGLCDRALECGPGDRAASARILDLKGRAQEQAAEVLKRRELPPGNALRAAVRTRQSACRLVLAELSHARLTQFRVRQRRRLPALENQASQCLVNLAWTIYGERENRAFAAGTQRRRQRRERRAFRRLYATCRLAVTVSDIDAVAHHRLAELALKMRRRRKAKEQASAAARIDPANPLYAAQLAFVLAADRDEGRASEACQRAERRIDWGSKGKEKAQDLVIHAYERLPDIDHAARLRRRKQLSGEIATAGEDLRVLQQLMERCRREGRDWETAYLRAVVGRLIRDDPRRDLAERGGDADRYFRKALGWFEHEQHDDPRIAELHSDRSKALAMQPGRSGNALAEAERAVTRCPLEPSYRAVLASAYEVGGDLDNACSEARRALLLEPDNPDMHYRLGELKWKLAESLADPRAHNAVRIEASQEFDEALSLYEYDQREKRRTTHWWLAMSYFALSRFADVPEQLFVLSSIARREDASIEERGLEAATELWLGMTYRKLQKFAEAEQHASRAIEVATQLEKERQPLTMNLTGALRDDRWPLGLVLALGHMQVSGCHADRSGDLSKARDQLTFASDALERMGNASRGKSSDAAAVEDAWANYRAESGRLLLAEGNAAHAIQELKESTNLDPGEADVYLLLARAHVLAAQRLKEVDWQEHVRNARHACRRTREIGGADHPDTDAADELEAELHRIEGTAKVGSASIENGGGGGRFARATEPDAVDDDSELPRGPG